MIIEDYIMSINLIYSNYKSKSILLNQKRESLTEELKSLDLPDIQRWYKNTIHLSVFNYTEIIETEEYKYNKTSINNYIKNFIKTHNRKDEDLYCPYIGFYIHFKENAANKEIIKDIEIYETSFFLITKDGKELTNKEFYESRKWTKFELNLLKNIIYSCIREIKKENPKDGINNIYINNIRKYKEKTKGYIDWDYSELTPVTEKELIKMLTYNHNNKK